MSKRRQHLVEVVQSTLDKEGLTVNALAGQLKGVGVGKDAVYAFFNGKNVTVDTLLAVLDACGIFMLWTGIKPEKGTLREKWKLPPAKLSQKQRLAVRRKGFTPPK
jgi:hypothetical protein